MGILNDQLNSKDKQQEAKEKLAQSRENAKNSLIGIGVAGKDFLKAATTVAWEGMKAQKEEKFANIKSKEKSKEKNQSRKMKLLKWLLNQIKKNLAKAKTLVGKLTRVIKVKDTSKKGTKEQEIYKSDVKNPQGQKVTLQQIEERFNGENKEKSKNSKEEVKAAETKEESKNSKEEVKTVKPKKESEAEKELKAAQEKEKGLKQKLNEIDKSVDNKNQSEVAELYKELAEVRKQKTSLEKDVLRESVPLEVRFKNQLNDNKDVEALNAKLKGLEETKADFEKYKGTFAFELEYKEKHDNCVADIAKTKEQIAGYTRDKKMESLVDKKHATEREISRFEGMKDTKGKEYASIMLSRLEEKLSKVNVEIALLEGKTVQEDMKDKIESLKQEMKNIDNLGWSDASKEVEKEKIALEIAVWEKRLKVIA